MSPFMGNSGQFSTIYSTLHKMVIQVSIVCILFFNIAYKHIFTVLIRLSKQPPIHELREAWNCHLIWCFFKYIVILLCLRFLIATLISFTVPMKLVPLLNCIILTCNLCARNLCNERIKKSDHMSLESSIWAGLVLRCVKITLYVFNVPWF